MERIYTTLKFRRVKRFRNKWKAKQRFEKLEENMCEYKREMIVDFEDKLHVYWSKMVILRICSFLLLMISIINWNSFPSFFILIAISALFIAVSGFFQNKLQKTNRGYLLALSVIDKIIKQEETKLKNTYNL